MKKLIKTVLFLISFILINNVYAQTVRIYFYSYGATDHSSNITIDEDIVALKKDGSYYMEYDSRETIKKINSINGEVFTLTKNGVSPTKGSEWYVIGKDSKKHYYSQNKKYSVSDIVKELGLGNEDLVEINLHVNWEVKNSSSSNYKIKIKYDINGGKLANKHGDNISVGIFGIIKNKGKDLKSEVAYNNGVNLYNLNNPKRINVVRKGYYVDLTSAWNTKKDGTGKSFAQSRIYKTSDFCDSSKKDCEITLYVNWKKVHYVNIEYNMNGGKLADQHSDNISASGNTIKCKNKTDCFRIKYNSKTGSTGLANYNNKRHINITKKGYIAARSMEWNTKKDGTGKSFNQNKVYKASDFCNASKKDCKIVLYANWVMKEPKVGTYVYNGEGGCYHIWYAIIPKNYKMHYSYGNDTVLGKEKTSENAKRHGAKLAIDTEFLGFPIVNNEKLGIGDSVSNMDFTVSYDLDSNGLVKYDNNRRYDIFRVNTTSANKGGIDFQDTNIGFGYGGNGVDYNGKTIYMGLYEQTVMNGVLASTHFPYLEKEKHPRSWLGYDYQGNQYIAVSSGRGVSSTVDNKTCPNKIGIDYKEEYAILNKIKPSGAKIKTLFNLDGGGSVSIVYNGKKLNPNMDEETVLDPRGYYVATGNTLERAVYGIFYWKW